MNKKINSNNDVEEFNYFSGKFIKNNQKNKKIFNSLTQKSTKNLYSEKSIACNKLDTHDSNFSNTVDDQIKRRWAWVEVDLRAISNNLRVTKNFVGPNVKIMAIVKANAYGHGTVRVAKTALNSGASMLGVSNVNEALELRFAGINCPILVLTQPPKTSIDCLAKYSIMPSIYTADFAIKYGEACMNQNKTAPYHLAVNTGMNRIGVDWDKASNLLAQINFHKALKLEGTFTHFATADESETLDFEKQYRRFCLCLDTLKSSGFNPGIIHCANTAAIFRYKKTHFDMVRIGIGMYGYYVSDDIKPKVKLIPALSVHARIVDERIVGIGEGVSYSMNYRARNSVKICVVPLGYADGLPRILSNKINVLYKGYKLPQVGNICMDQFMFEIDMNSSYAQKNLNAQIGDEVVVIGSQTNSETNQTSSISLDELADKSSTIVNELACDLCLRMPIVYK